MKILIVEDEVLVALSMDDTLSEAGHFVTGLARDELVAMGLAGTTRPDLALVDMTLARGGSGAAVVRHLRKRYGVPSIFVSGNPGSCHQVGFQIGALGCLSKPFSPDELVEAVEAAATILRKGSPQQVPPNLQLYYVM